MKYDVKSVLTTDQIVLGMDATDRYDLIRQAARLLQDTTDVVRDLDQLVADAIDREEELATGIEHGVAMPHARTRAVTGLRAAFIRPRNPVDFGSPDGGESDIIFFSAIPMDNVDAYLHLTASLVRRLHNPRVLDQLRDAQSPDDVLRTLTD